jgi:hypothetical protein
LIEPPCEMLGLVLLVVDDTLLSDGLENVEELVEDDGLVLLVIEELLEVSRLADCLLIVTTWAQSSRSTEAAADALPMPLALPETLAAGDVARQVMLTLSPLFKSLSDAAALASTLSVRLLAPVVAGEAFRVMVRAV